MSNIDLDALERRIRAGDRSMPSEVLLAAVAMARRTEEAEREAAEERARLADQAAAHEEQLRRQAAVAERVAANATRERVRAEQAEAAYARMCIDEQKRATIEERLARPPLDQAHVPALRQMLEDERDDLLHVDSERHAHTAGVIRARVAALEAVLGEEARL